MRKLLFAGALAVSLAVVPALGDGPSGSHEEDGTTWDNQVTCGSGVNTPVATVYAGTNGVEVCNDSGPLPIQGRAIVTTEQGGYAAADGDSSNPGQAAGWVRVDRSGVRCGDDSGRRDATHPTSVDTVQDCG
jgi:hypothetical protein